MASKLLVVVDEGEGQVDVQWVGSFRGCSSLPGFKRDHEVDPGCRPLDFELVNEILTKNLTKQLLKLIIYPQRTIRTTWDKEHPITTKYRNDHITMVPSAV